METDQFADLIERWKWTDNDGTGRPGIELCSNNPLGAEKRRDRKQGLPGATNKGGKAPRRGKSGVLKKVGQQNALKGALNKRNSASPDQKFVTLQNLKEVALRELEKQTEISDWFLGIFDTEQFDQFLQCLLNYFAFFLDKKIKEEKPRTMFLEPSARELAEQAALANETNEALRKLGFAYSIILLGIGTSQYHHMGAGSERVSMVYKDREKSECLYEFSSIIVYIGFRQKHREAIGKETGRLFRSETFNGATRKPADSTEAIVASEKISLSEYKRRNKSHLSTKTMSNQQCPVISSILPTPKEKSPWLFKKLEMQTLPVFEKLEGQTIEDFKIDLRKLRLGIIGEPLSQFEVETLKPIGQEAEDEDSINAAALQSSQLGFPKSTSDEKEPMTSKEGDKSVTHLQDPLSRETTALSQLTVDAEFD